MRLAELQHTEANNSPLPYHSRTHTLSQQQRSWALPKVISFPPTPGTALDMPVSKLTLKMQPCLWMGYFLMMHFSATLDFWGYTSCWIEILCLCINLLFMVTCIKKWWVGLSVSVKCEGRHLVGKIFKCSPWIFSKNLMTQILNCYNIFKPCHFDNAQVPPFYICFVSFCAV